MFSQPEFSSSGESHRSQSPSLGRPKKGKAQQKQQRAERSLTTTIVGPAKTRVTKLTHKAEELLESGPAILSTLTLVNPDMEGQQANLQTADAALIDMKRVVHKLTSLYHYVEVKFDTPAMNASTLKDFYLKQVFTLIAKANPHNLATQLQEHVFALEAQLHELGFKFTSFIPSDEYESEDVDTIADRVKRTVETNDSSNTPLVAQQMTGVMAHNPEQMRKFLEMEERVKHLQLELENKQKEVMLMEHDNLRKNSELESWHLTQHASLQKNLLESMERESLATKRATQLQAEVDKSKTLPTRREEITMAQQTQSHAPSRLNHPESTLNADQFRAGRPTTTNSDQIRVDIPYTLNSDQTRTGRPTARHPDQIRTDRPTTVAPPEHLQDSASAPNLCRDPVLEMLQKIHEETMRSNTDMRANIAEILNNQHSQKERDQADSYAEQYENAFAGPADLPNGGQQANAGRFSSAGNSHQEYASSPRHPYQMSPYDRKFDPTKYLSTFDGTGDLEHFQYEFEAHVTKDPRFSPNERFLILRKVLAGQALQHLNLSKNPQEAIEKTFALLQKTYGNNQTQGGLLAKLANLPFHPSDPQQMRQNLATIITLMEQLKQKGIPENDPRTIKDIVRKLPVSIRRDVCEFMIAMGDTITLTEVIDKIYSKIAGLDMDRNILTQGTGRALNEITDSFGEINLVNASESPYVGSTHKPYPQPQGEKGGYSQKPQGDKAPLAYVKEGLPRQYTDPITGQTLEGYYAPGNNRPDIKIMHRTFPYQSPEKTKCPVCEGPHNAIRCTLTSTDFRKLSAEKGLCPICASKHAIEACRSQFKCGYCGGTHHMGGCPKKEFYRDPQNYPSGAKERQQFFRAAAGNTSH